MGEDLYEVQLRKRSLAEVRVKYFIDTFFTTEEIVQSIIDDIKRFDYDSELFDFYQEELRRYVDENAKHIGTKWYKRYIDMVAADSTWMYVLMNPEDIKLYHEYQVVNEKYKIHNIEEVQI